MPKLTSRAHPVHFLFLFFLPFFLNHAESQQLQAQEQQILSRLRHYWENLPTLSHWASPNSSSSHCSWPEITCTDGSVTGLVLANKGVSGTVPSFICELGNLTTLDLSYNNIPGGFPTVLYSCSKLEHLDISQNYFVGSVPSDIDRMANLQYLSLAANNFSFDIPPAIGRLSQLKDLYLYQNQFNGTYPDEIASLSNLEALGMAYNRKFRPSTFPVKFITGLKKLTYLWMADMNLVGQIPETISNMEALQFLDLSMNPLSGKIPSGIFTLKNLSEIYLFANNLTGEIPQRIESLELSVIDLSENNLTGKIPDGFGKLDKLQSLVLIYNQLSGEIPESLGRLPALTDVRLFSNNFSGTLPPDFGRYSPLEGFEVNSNQFTGPLPENLCLAGKLTGVAAYDNDLTGELPESLGKCDSLRIVTVSNNRLSGKIPEGLWTSLNLSTVKLDNNDFSGELPDRISWNLSRIEINNNRFSGNIPAAINAWKSLVVFEASNNLLSGPIPVGLTDHPLLTTLSLGQNNLSGNLPETIVSWKSLTMLNLSHNKLSGPIPEKIGSLPVLRQIDLSDNQLSGHIPSQLGLLLLTFLNLSSNRLTGKIPDELENSAYSSSFLSNTGLCASNPTAVQLKACNGGSRGSKEVSSNTLIFIVLAIASASLTVIIIGAYIPKIYQNRKPDSNYTWKLTPFHRLEFTESNILSGLIEQNLVGSGGSGKVYQVPIHQSGGFVAVKRIFNTRKLDYKLEKEFLAEVHILGKIRHLNIVKLLCCISSENSKLLVYEYMENRSLDQWLHLKKRQSNSNDVLLDWPKRLKIAIGAAQGLCYMHHDCSPPIIHRDVKSSNVLLDSEFNAKIADFGLARILIKPGEVDTMSAVAGTFGYIAPEYAHTTRINAKIDVYSFGVILLELATGREPNDGTEDMSLAEWAWRHMQEGNPIWDALDKEIREPCYLDEMSCVFRLGIICTGTFPSARPSMKEVLQVLQKCLSRLDIRVQKNTRDEVSATPLLRNSKREQALLDEDSSLLCRTY
ncbi:hypothetical protein CDL15_Pgr000941 [Punica granatum]|uniref:Protein kinase domain-containing protein n=1 Tax=Punica granatum TaxID=22663 RepID=A0A218XJ70_PUNGR|nr:hypothetical protein CDL15_Pgr000941 [Punica granatum]PKI50050.1 hypothetical protein CRG98_029550 [Punica granatum]